MSQTFTRQPWIRNSRYDSLFILLPPFMALLAVIAMPPAYRQGTVMPLAAWVILVLCMDVGHVYSTLFRTYFDPGRFSRQRALYIVIPVASYVAGVLLYSTGSWLFWRVLAYVAVFHFIRQQYGFMRLYSRQEQASRINRLIDTLTIYTATLYPIIYWHLSPGRQFNWFMEGDFLQWNSPVLRQAAAIFYVSILSVYVIKEIFILRNGALFNVPRNAVIIGTAVSWYFGIVYFNGDLAFTLLNIVSHGIPYMALVWATARQTKGGAEGRPGINRMLGRSYGIWIFLAVILLAAWLEEGMWDRWVWSGEHAPVFQLFSIIPELGSDHLFVWLVPLLALPQATHYVLDGFIWRRKDG